MLTETGMLRPFYGVSELGLFNTLESKTNAERYIQDFNETKYYTRDPWNCFMTHVDINDLSCNRKKYTRL